MPHATAGKYQKSSQIIADKKEGESLPFFVRCKVSVPQAEKFGGFAKKLLKKVINLDEK